MKLSEAIFLGSKLGPQAFEVYRAGDATCALGAALEAEKIEVKDIFVAWPFLRQKVNCPDCDRYYIPAESVIFHLNDHHCWTRERIADWVAKIERSSENNSSSPEVSRETVLCD